MVLVPSGAAKVHEHIVAVRDLDPIHPYREIGSIEGHITSIGEDGFGKPFIMVRGRVTRTDVKCFLSGPAFEALEQQRVGNVIWRGRRVHAIGVVSYRSEGKAFRADISRLDFADPTEYLPSLKDILDPDFTGGLTSDEYVEKLRNGEA